MMRKINQIIGTNMFEYFMLTSILLMGFIMRLYRINNPIADWHSWRQADTASVSRIYLEKGINLLYPKYHDISSIQTGIFNPEGYRMVEFPIYNALNAFFASSFNSISLEVWARLISISFALLSALGLYFIGKRILGKWGGLLSAFFFLFIPYNIYFTRVILPEPLGVAAAVWGLYLFMVYVEKENKVTLFISSILFAISLLIKPFFAFYLLPAAYLLVSKHGLSALQKNKKYLTTFVMFFLIVFLPLLIWRKWISNFPEGIPFFEWAFNGDRIRFHPAFWRWIFGERIGHLILGSWGLIPLLFGVISSKPKKYFVNWFLFSMFLYLSIVATANVRHDYYQIMIIPALSLGLASGIIYLWTNEVFNKELSKVIAVFSVLVMLITGWSLVKDNFNVNHPELIEIGKEVDRITPKDAQIIIPYNGDTAFLYQTHRSGWPAVDDSIENIIERGADYFVSIDFNHPDTIKVLQTYQVLEKTDKFVIVDLHKPIKK